MTRMLLRKILFSLHGSRHNAVILLDVFTHFSEENKNSLKVPKQNWPSLSYLFFSLENVHRKLHVLELNCSFNSGKNK